MGDLQVWPLENLINFKKLFFFKSVEQLKGSSDEFSSLGVCIEEDEGEESTELLEDRGKLQKLSFRERSCSQQG